MKLDARGKLWAGIAAAAVAIVAFAPPPQESAVVELPEIGRASCREKV